MAKPSKPSGRKLWNEADTELLRRHYADSRTADLATALERSEQQVYAKAMKLGLKKSREHIAQMARECMARPEHPAKASRFPKGQVPANKGLRRPGYAPGRMASTQFKKGSKPHTWLPVGSFRVVPDGTLEQKFSDDPGPPGARWKSYARIVWEAANGPVPAGHVVAFRDGRPRTEPKQVTLDILECITRTELMRRNSIHSMPPELADVSRLRGRLTRAIHRREKEQQT